MSLDSVQRHFVQGDCVSYPSPFWHFVLGTSFLTPHNIPEGVVIPYGFGWHQLDDDHEEIGDQLSPSKVESLFAGIEFF